MPTSGTEWFADAVPAGVLYEVTQNQRHKHLAVGDIVQKIILPDSSALLMRSDNTFHYLVDQYNRYVVLRKVDTEAKEIGLPTTGVPVCPSTTNTAIEQIQRRLQYLTTKRKEPQLPVFPHPHGAEYAQAVQYRNDVERLLRIRNEILHSAYRMGQGQRLSDEDALRLHKAACQVSNVVADMEKRAAQFQVLAGPHSPEPVNPSETPLPQ